MTTFQQESDNIAGKTQDERLAFASAAVAPRTLAETLVALANNNGGTVALGVNSKGVALATNDTGALRDLALRAALLADPPMVLPVPVEVASPQGTWLRIVVPPGLANVFHLQGVYLTRSGAHNRPMTTAELRALLLARSESSIESHPVENASLADLDARAVGRYLDRLMLLPEGEAALDSSLVIDALTARGCLVRDASGEVHPTVGGLLVLGKEPQQFLRHADVLCVRYPGDAMGDEFLRQEIGGALPEQIRLAEAFVASNMRRSTRIEGLARTEIGEYPLAVVREVIVNAVAHRDYALRGEGVRVLLFRNRLEVYSPGRLPGHVTLENLLQERYSRNETLVALLSDLGYIERLGYGIDRVYATLAAAGLPAPEFAETAAGFVVTLRSLPENAIATSDATTPNQTVQRRTKLSAAKLPPEDAAQARVLGLNERQILALAWVRENGRITNSELQEMVPDISAETVRRDLADMVERNLLIRIGAKRATYYILK